MGRLKVGVIGAGGSIAACHIGAYLKNPDAELYALCDIDEARLKTAAEKYNVSRAFTDINALLELSELDAVSVCTWNNSHAECAIAALNRGKHVLCEKPPAVTVGQAAAMKEAADRNGKLLMFGFVRRFGNDYRILKDLIGGGFLGEIYFAKAVYLRRDGNPGGWFGDKSRSGGGPLIDLGVHVIDFVRSIAGNPRPVSVYAVTYQKLFDRKNIKCGEKYTASGRSENDVCDVEDLAAALIRFDGGLTLSVETSFALNLKNDVGKIELFGTKGGAKLDPELEIYTETNDYLTNVSFAANTALSFDGLFENEISHFVDCLTKGEPCLSPAQDGIDIMKIIAAVYRSAETGHEVSL